MRSKISLGSRACDYTQNRSQPCLGAAEISIVKTVSEKGWDQFHPVDTQLAQAVLGKGLRCYYCFSAKDFSLAFGWI